MEKLHEKKCIACDGSTPPFDTSEIHKYLKNIDGWDVKINEKKIKKFSEKKIKFFK